jgi:hypothetical protein
MKPIVILLTLCLWGTGAWAQAAGTPVSSSSPWISGDPKHFLDDEESIRLTDKSAPFVLSGLVHSTPVEHVALSIRARHSIGYYVKDGSPNSAFSMREMRAGGAIPTVIGPWAPGRKAAFPYDPGSDEKAGLPTREASTPRGLTRLAAAAGVVGMAQDTPSFPIGAAVANVDQFGADPTGIRDSTAAIQNAVNANVQHLSFTAGGTYLVKAPIIIPPLPDANLKALGRDIDGDGARIVASDGVSNVFRITTSAWPNMHLNLKFHDFVFDGAVTESFIKFETAAASNNHFFNIHTTHRPSCISLLQFYNVSAIAQPGMFSVRNLAANCKHTVSFSVGKGALGDFDNFRLEEIANASLDADSAAIRVGDNAHLVYSDLNNILKGGDGNGISTSTVNSYVLKSRIARMYLEPNAGKVHYGIYAGIFDTIVENIWAYIVDHKLMPDVKVVYLFGSGNSVRNVGIHSRAASGPPYASTYYPAIKIGFGSNNTIEFDPQHLVNGFEAYDEATSATHFTNAPFPIVRNSSSTLQKWMLADSVIDNFGQGAPATLTLPPAAFGYRARLTISTPGHALGVKPSTTNIIHLDGRRLAVGSKVSNRVPAVGDALLCYSFRSGASTYAWICRSEGGAWVDGGL